MRVVRIRGLLGVYLQQRRRQPKCHQADAKERCRLTHLEYTTKRLHATGCRHPVWCCVHSTPATLASVHQHGLVWCQVLRYAATATRIFLHCVLQGALWSPSKRALPPTPEGIVRARTKEFEARGQVRFFQDFREFRIGAAGVRQLGAHFRLPSVWPADLPSLPLLPAHPHLVVRETTGEPCLSPTSGVPLNRID